MFGSGVDKRSGEHKKGRMAKSPTSATPAAIIAAARRQPTGAYLFIGEPFQTESLARELIDVLVPAANRSLNLETYDGRTTAIGNILDSARTHGLFGGRKVLWVRESTVFLSGEKRGDIVDAMFDAWADERRGPAAEKLLVLAALAGWSQEQVESTQWEDLGKTDARALFGRALSAAEGSAVAAIHAHAADKSLAVAAFRDESALLEDFLRAGVSADAVLIFTASAVDRRKRLFKVMQEHATVAEFEVTRERSGALAAESVEQLIGEVLERAGKRAAPGARRLIARRAGSDPAALRMELEKLCLYAGDAEQIGEDAVAASFRDLAESWIFDFTRALSQGQAGTALTLLRGLFAQGEPPLRLLALIARELRMLLVARDCLADSLRGTWTPRLPFAQFRDRLLPSLSEEEKEAFAGAHPFAIYLALQNAARATTRGLQRALLELQEIDIALKSTRADAQMRLEAFVLTLCAAFRAR